MPVKKGGQFIGGQWQGLGYRVCRYDFCVGFSLESDAILIDSFLTIRRNVSNWVDTLNYWSTEGLKSELWPNDKINKIDNANLALKDYEQRLGLYAIKYHPFINRLEVWARGLGFTISEDKRDVLTQAVNDPVFDI